MSKKSKKKQGGGKPSSDRLVMKAKQSKELKAKVNPFERRFTREKHKVVNRSDSELIAINKKAIQYRVNIGVWDYILLTLTSLSWILLGRLLIVQNWLGTWATR